MEARSVGSGTRRSRAPRGLGGDGRSGQRISQLIESSFGLRNLSPDSGTGSGRAVSRGAFSAAALALKGMRGTGTDNGTRPRRQFRGMRAV